MAMFSVAGGVGVERVLAVGGVVVAVGVGGERSTAGGGVVAAGGVGGECMAPLAVLPTVVFLAFVADGVAEGAL